MGGEPIRIERADVDRILAETADDAYNNAILFGPFGTGKTFTAFGAVKPEQEVVIVTITESMTSSALVGHFLVKGGETVWHDNAPALYAWEHGALLVLNEVDKARGDVEDICHVLLDDPMVARMRLASGKEVAPQPGFRCIATMNGDIDDLPGAMLDRFSIKLEVARPTPAALGTLPDDVAAAVDYMYDEAERTGAVTPDVTFRQLRNFAQHRERFGEPTAALMVTGRGKRAVALVELIDLLRLQAASPQAAPIANPFTAVESEPLRHRAVGDAAQPRQLG